MESSVLRGIRFPDRAESLGEFAGYKVFLDPWEPLAEDLRRYYDGLALRRESRVLAVHGAQGTGKTMFASKLKSDFILTQDAQPVIDPDEANLWHRIAGGPDFSRELIADATATSDLLLIEDQPDWIDAAKEWIRNRPQRRCIVVADNAERPYFRQGLVAVSDAEYVTLSADPALTTLAAQRFVALCRTDFRGAMFILLSNDDVFLLALDEAVQGQHAGLLTLTQLPLPDGPTKETVVRVNTNRLNPVSYWFCLDKAGPEEKTAVKRALEGASNFPDSFQAVDTAIRTATPTRIGRPARQNVITLCVLAPIQDAGLVDASEFGEVQRVEVDHAWCSLRVFSSGWAPESLGERETGLLESEWVLRIAVLGAPFMASLLTIADDDLFPDEDLQACRRMLDLLKVFHGPGAWQATRSEYTSTFRSLVDEWPRNDRNLDDFWAQGQTRSQKYEDGLAKLLPGYNTAMGGFLRYRPDYVIEPYRPCSVLSAVSDSQEAINVAIRRDAHVFEFTATNRYSASTVRTYLASKLRNYVELTQEQ